MMIVKKKHPSEAFYLIKMMIEIGMSMCDYQVTYIIIISFLVTFGSRYHMQKVRNLVTL